MNLPDYSEYLKQPGMLAWIEQEWKNNPAMHDDHARVVNEFIEKLGVEDIIEVGCGTGELATRINRSRYIGVDSNMDAITYARLKCPDRYFEVCDIRQANHYGDLVFCFGFLKHFGLHEWFDIFKKVSSFGQYFIFDMPIGETKDDGTEFHHVWKSMKELMKDIESIDFNILKIINPHLVEPVFICKRKTNGL